MSHLEGEPRAWRAELWMAIAGPIVSLVIGGACIALAGTALSGDFAADPLAAIGELGPGATLMLWLGPVNTVLAVFNLVPAFPLDGGRVVRALLWGAGGDFAKATRWASALGQAFGWLLIAAGVAMMLGLTVPVFGTGLVGGLWIALIGWFLHNAAHMSNRQAQLQQSLAGVRVADIMKTEFATVPKELPVQALIDDYFMSREQRCYPVVDGRKLAGIVCLDDLRRTRREDWPATRAGDIMTPAERLVTMPPSAPASEALTTLTSRRVNQLPIIERGEIQGLLSREDVLKWLAFFAPSSGSDPRAERLET
jgi:CBS domain-containing protein